MVAEDHKNDLPAFQVLLVTDVFVSRKQQIKARLLDTPAIAVRENPPYGVNCAVDVPVRGIGAKADRVITVRTIWIYETPDAPPRLVSA